MTAVKARIVCINTLGHVCTVLLPNWFAIEISGFTSLYILELLFFHSH